MQNLVQKRNEDAETSSTKKRKNAEMRSAKTHKRRNGVSVNCRNSKAGSEICKWRGSRNEFSNGMGARLQK